MPWKIEELTWCNKWEDNWTDEDDNPVRFETKELADEALTDYLDDINQAVEAGDMKEGYNREGFRIIEDDKGDDTNAGTTINNN
jgi:hypothetical protein